MAKARVILRNSESFLGLYGRSWIKGQSKVIADSTVIEYFRRHSEFTVTDLEAGPEPAPVAPVKPAPAPKPAPVPEPAPAKADATGKLIAADLEGHTKAELLMFAFEQFGIELAMESKKAELIAQILAAQG